MEEIKNKSIGFEVLKALILGLFIVIGTFPVSDLTFSSGLDSPLIWVFNYLYHNGLDIGRQIIFPHGPLAFFTYPLQENIIIVILVTSLLKISLVFNIAWLQDSKEDTRWFTTFLFSYFLSIISGFTYLILANIVLLYCNYYKTEKPGFKIAAFILTAFAFYVKSYVAIISGIIFLSFVSFYFFRFKKYFKSVTDILIFIGTMLFFWILMYGTFTGFFKYALGLINLAQDNSSAAAYYPNNNWWVLSIYIVIILALPLINRSKKSLFYGLVFTFSIFAAWKHGMAREDIYHYRGLIIYSIIALFIYILFQKSNLYRNLILSVIAIFMLIINSQNAYNNESPKYELFRINNFIDFISNFSEIKAKAAEKIANNITSNKLPQSILDSIGNSKVDIYPWDYSIIPANNLNWQPRVVIQSYASYTSWLDKRNANHFRSGLAPEFLIIDRFFTGLNGGSYNSIDNRYFLNDEPLTILEIIRNYTFEHSDDRFLILKKNQQAIEAEEEEISKINSRWGEWINVPKRDQGLLRAKLIFNKTFLQRVKSFFYKDEEFWIYLRLQNGDVHQYKIVPKNAKDGLWVNPYIFDSKSYYTVDQVMFTSSNKKIISDNLILKWENYQFKNEPDLVLKFFNLYDN